MSSSLHPITYKIKETNIFILKTTILFCLRESFSKRLDLAEVTGLYIDKYPEIIEMIG